MSQARVKVDGARKLRAELRRAGISLDDLKDANARVADYVAQQARTRAPRRTGRLAASLRGNRAQARAVVSAPRVIYGPPIHWGWPRRNIRPNPWIYETAQNTEAQWLPMYEQAISAVIDKLGGTYP